MNRELEHLLIMKGRSALPPVLIAAAECSPLSKTGGLADVAGALPKSLGALGFDARVIAPLHHVTKEKYADKIRHICHFQVYLGWRSQYAGLEEIEIDGVKIYLIDNEFYFGDRIYRGGEAEGEQYAFFQRAVLEAIPLLDFQPEVLHCNDWHTAMLPFLIKTQYGGRPQGGLKTVLTIHNIAFQGKFGFDFVCDMLNVDRRWCSIDGIAHYGCANFLKAGCLFADRVNTVSPSYAAEIRTSAFGEGLQELLNYRGGDMSGIINGIDTQVFDPATDKCLAVNYDHTCPEKKRDNKTALMAELGLDCGPDTPLIAMVTRMTAQKGFDLVLQGIDAMLEMGAAFVLLGTGDAGYENAMRGLENRYRGRLCAYLSYNADLANRIYAGADFLLMPSAFEPCGLSQMIAMRYGTLPIVHEVGGLRDTVIPYNRFTGEGDGFSFAPYSRDAMMSAVALALDTYRDGQAMSRLIHAAMTKDFSFAGPALDYAKLYVSTLPRQSDRVYHDSFDERFRCPTGAVKCGGEVRLRLTAPDYAASALLLVDGMEPRAMERREDGFETVFTAPDTPQTVWYGFLVDGGVYCGANGLGGAPMSPFQMTVYDGSFTVPGWAEGAVMYQIFPDRYARGGAAFENGVKYHRSLGREVEVHRNWDEKVKWQPTTGEYYRPNDFYGGTLTGIKNALPRLREMGVDCIYLNPVFEADSNHRYNTADYMKIDPMLGTERNFTLLCSQAKKLGIRIILDGVFSHTGDDSVYFNRPGRYAGPGAYQGPESRFYPWYDFRAFPDDYRCWWGFDSLPEVDESCPEWQDFVISGENSVMKKWLRAGASGWRLDVADELPDGVIELMRGAVKGQDPEALILGEVWEDATSKISYGQKRRYALGGGLDSVMNYPFRSAVIDFALGRADAFALRDFLLGQKMNYPAPMYRCLMNLLGSHDTARLRTVLGLGDDGSSWDRERQSEFVLSPEQNALGRARQRLCAAIQFAMPGIACVYYGDEEGMQGFRDPFCRGPYAPGGDDELRDYYAALAAGRNASGLLRHGDAAFAAADADTLCILRYSGPQAAVAAVNRSGQDRSFRLDISAFRGLSSADAEALPDSVSFSVPAMDAVTLELG